ncbi:tetratricopeptide repeat protein, partial [bacterium]|nr:tetratricopeptide repeat protein [bacterium]
MIKKLFFISAIFVLAVFVAQAIANDKISVSQDMDASLKFYKQGKELYEQEKYTESLDKFKETLKFDPDNDLAKLYIDKIMYKIDPSYSYKRMLSSDKEKIDVLVREYYDLGEKYFALKDYEKAINAFKRVWAINPHHECTSYALVYIDKAQEDTGKLGQQILEQEQKPSSIQEIAPYIEKQSFEELFKKGQDFFRVKDYSGAEKVFKQAVDSYSGNKKDVLYRKCLLYYDRAKMA